jgi:1-aminocyclopropane-1-carboxylate deaminase/D-cysteine desulfhydrase-like pyridoxal-dependent ACC family enzyme
MTSHPARILLGDYPTPVEPLPTFGRPGTELWVKRDDLTAPRYGGNKVRKLEYVLGDARARGMTELLTAGAVGSHHVLATALYGKEHGFAVRAVLVPQPPSEHALANVRALVGLGAEIFPSPEALAPLAVGRRLRRGTYFVQLGGSSVLGAMGYVAGARELAAQVRAGQAPAPDLVVVTLGSGGTAAGLAAGFALEGMATRVLGVSVAGPPSAIAWYTHHLARACVRQAGGDVSRRDIAARLTTTSRWLGRGYGYPTEEGARATALAEGAGLTLDATYTAKTFAATLDVVASGREKVVLFWHTLSSASLAPLLVAAPASLPPQIAALLR